MDFKLVERKENALLERTEVEAEISFDSATPSLPQMRDMIVQKLGCSPDLTVIRKCSPRFGEKKMSVDVHIYKTPERMKQVEEGYILKRNKLGGEEKAAGGKAGEASKEEKAPAQAEKAEKKEAPAQAEKPEEKKKPESGEKEAEPAEGEASSGQQEKKEEGKPPAQAEAKKEGEKEAKPAQDSGDEGKKE